jgi:hypothetical protein
MGLLYVADGKVRTMMKRILKRQARTKGSKGSEQMQIERDPTVILNIKKKMLEAIRQQGMFSGIWS